MTAPVQRSSVEGVLANHEKRVGILEAVSPLAVYLASGQAFTVYDSSGNPIFRVDENGDLHGKTGKALTFDL